MAERFKKFLESSRLPLFVAFLSGILALPSLWVGFQFDDFYHRAIVLNPQDTPWVSSPREMFTLSKGDPKQIQSLLDSGFIPWWTNQKLRLSFWRPMSAEIQAWEYRTWPNNAMPIHLILIVILIILTGLASVFFRRVLGKTWVSGLAAILYAVDDGHGVAVGWIAGHNTLLVVLFGTTTLILHDIWRKEGNLFAFVAGMFFWVFTLLSNEGAIAILAFVFSYCLFLEPLEDINRFKPFIPYLFIFLIWLAYYQYLGHGIHGGGFYVDPFRETVDYFKQLIFYGPILLLGQWALPTAQIFPFFSLEMRYGVFLLSTGFVCLFIVFLMPLIRSNPASRFFATSMVLSLAPICSTIPSDRLLLFVGLAAFGLMAQFIEHGFMAVKSLPLPRGAKIVKAISIFLLVLHIPLNMLAFPVAAFSMATFYKLTKSQYEDLFNLPGDKGESIFLVNSPCAFFTAIANRMANTPGSVHRNFYHLSPGIYATRIKRIDDRTVSSQ